MPFVKVQKTKAYFSRFQTKFRRRIEGKTDYRARKRLVVVDKNKYSAPRHRLVVRLTNKYVIAQVIRSELDHDVVVASAYSSELKRYGIAFGYKNYAACYATGLLVARRVLVAHGLADTYKGQETATGEIVSTEFTNDAGKKRTYWVKEVVAERKPFRAVLDVGIRPTTTGARIFGVMKGASDGGLDIPHNHKRFPGYNRDSNDYKPAIHKARIFGEHVASWMSKLKSGNPQGFQAYFRQYIAGGATADNLPGLYKKAHAAIRANPAPQSNRKNYKPDNKFKKASKITLAERKKRVANTKTALLNKLRAARGAAAAAEDDE